MGSQKPECNAPRGEPTVPMLPAQQIEFSRTEIHALQSVEIGAEFEVRMAEWLEGRAYPSLRTRTEVIDRETHTTVAPSALFRGLQWAL